MSKSYSMTGWRLGYTAGPKPLIAGMNLVQDQSTSNPSSISQKAALAALKGSADTITTMVDEYRARRELIVSGLNALDGVNCRSPEGAFYVFPNVTGLMERTYKGAKLGNSSRISEVLLEDFRVAVMPGAPFGAEGYLRMSFVTSREVIQKGLSRMREFVAALK
jgi:aspartate aminotransferase